MIEAVDICIRFGEESVVEHFSYHICEGDFVCVVGKSGCGKTSLLKAFIGLAPLAQGRIRVGEWVLGEKTCDMVRKQTVYLPQDLSFPSETVEELVRQTLRIGRAGSVQYSEQELRGNLQLLGLEPEVLGKRMAEISGGQRQRIMLATVAMLDKRLWLLDEPTAALDATSRDLVAEFLLGQQRRGRTIVAVSHDRHFAAYCSDVITLDSTEDYDGNH